MRLAIDIDSTLHPYWDQLATIAKRRFGIELPYDTQYTWEIDRLRPEQLKACVKESHGPEHVLSATPYPGAVESIRTWHEAGHFIHITSHRATTAHGHTTEWLETIGLPYDELYCSYDKISRCVEIGIDVLIDDSPVNLAQAGERGIQGATLTHPWNAAVPNVISAPDWPTLAARLQPLLK